jgi:hypothetical protein
LGIDIRKYYKLWTIFLTLCGLRDFYAMLIINGGLAKTPKNGEWAAIASL